MELEPFRRTDGAEDAEEDKKEDRRGAAGDRGVAGAGDGGGLIPSRFMPIISGYVPSPGIL